MSGAQLERSAGFGLPALGTSGAALLFLVLIVAPRCRLPVLFAFLPLQVWYCISYIPYGQEMLKSCMGSCCTGLLG